MFKNSYDVAIVGGGLHGLSLAYHLAKEGSKVAVLEQGYIGGGASGRNTAIIETSYTTEEWINFSKENVRMWSVLSDELGINVLFSQMGFLQLAYTEEEVAKSSDSVELQNRCGVPSKLIEPMEIRELAPALNLEGVRDGAFNPIGGTAHHDAAVWGYARNAVKLGAELGTYTEVTGIEVDHGRAVGVRTERGFVKADTVVNTAGAYSNVIAKMAGIEIPTKPRRTEALVTEALKPFLDTVVESMNSSTYFWQTQRGEVVAGTVVASLASKPTYSMAGTRLFMETLAKRLSFLLPGLKGVNVLRQWAGIVDDSPDRSPLLGEVEGLKDFVLDCGWGGYGFKTAPFAGKLLAEYILHGRKPPLLEAFSPKRFSEGRLVAEKGMTIARAMKEG